jgi:hypothetical protein
MDAPPTAQVPVQDLPIPLERDVFLRTLIRELAGTLQDVVGLEEASGFISVVGQRIGDQINESYREALDVPNLSREQVADVLVDLKRRIRGTSTSSRRTTRRSSWATAPARSPRRSSAGRRCA